MGKDMNRNLRKDQFLNKNEAARLKAERSALNDVSGGFKTGPQGNPGTKRARTRSASKTKAIREDLS